MLFMLISFFIWWSEVLTLAPLPICYADSPDYPCEGYK